jgi:membrane protein YdbS with pleckstrin-like domain
MAEETVWHGSSSQWKNFGLYLVCILFAGLVVLIFAVVSRNGSPEVKNLSSFILLVLAVPIFMALARYLQTKNKVYELTNERLKTSEGVFSRVTETLELYRVKDLETQQPFLYRLVGIENVQLNTSDASSPSVFINAVPTSAGLGDKVRNHVEMIRAQKGVREIDVE